MSSFLNLVGSSGSFSGSDNDIRPVKDVAPLPFNNVTEKRRVVVGLDFGTFGTGISYMTLDNESEINYCSRWPGRAEFQYCKALTAILYRGSEPIAWGWEAQCQYSELDDLQKRHGDYYFVTHFKLALDRSSQREMPQLPPGLTIKDVIADFLNLFTRHCVDSILSDVYNTTLSKGNIQWCLTVPAIWKDDQKDAMRQAAHAAGMISAHNSDSLRIILEPEAAALHAHDAKQLLGLQPGDTLMMLDAGGGTVDLTVHTLQHQGRRMVLEETVPGDGGFCGSTYVDQDFVAWFRAKVGPSVFDSWKQQHYGEYMQMMSKWEAEKRLFKVGRKAREVHVILPPQLLNSMDDSLVLQLEEESSWDDRVLIDEQQMKAFFEPHVQSIVELAKGLAGRCPGGQVHKLLLVGGFCKSPYLVACLKERLGGVACPAKDIVVPEQPESTILQGAALAHSGPAVITSRKLRLTYGIRLKSTEDGDVPSDKKAWDQERQCYGVVYIRPIASRGTSIKVDDVITEQRLSSWSDTKTTSPIALYTMPAVHATSKRVYMDEPGLKELATLNVPVVPGGNDYFDASFMFGLEEIRITASNGKAIPEPISIVASYCENSF